MHLNVYATISLVSFIFCMVIAIFIYFKSVRNVYDNKLERLFVLTCLSLAFFWALIEFGYRQTQDFSTAYFLLKINVFWYLVFSFFLHFVLLFTENMKLLKNKLTILIIYLPAILFIMIDICTDFLFTVPVKESWGYMFGLPEFPLIHMISLSWAVVTGFFCMYVLFDYRHKTHNFIKKKQATYIIIAFSIPLIISFNTEYLLPIMRIRVPELFAPTFTLALIIICYTIWIERPIKNEKEYNNILKDMEKIINKIPHKNKF